MLVCTSTATGAGREKPPQPGYPKVKVSTGRIRIDIDDDARVSLDYEAALKLFEELKKVMDSLVVEVEKLHKDELQEIKDVKKKYAILRANLIKEG